MLSGKGGEPMKVVLCTECENCPEVELTPTGVRIGEEGNLATLTYKEWNLLVDLIQSGELKKVPV
jgi:hypothetical protein